MKSRTLTCAERFTICLSQQEADRVPFFLPLTIHCARALGLTPRDYFSRAEHVAEGQLWALRKFRHDGVAAAYYASLEFEAWGGTTIFHADAPPNPGAPIIRNAAEIATLSPPDIERSAPLQRCLTTIRLLAQKVPPGTPIFGSALSPFSLPIIQLGFDRYLDLLYEQPLLAARLIQLNDEFCQNWIRAQLAAGASGISYVDPFSSSDLSSDDLFERYGFAPLKAAIAQGSTSIGLASARCLGRLERFIAAGAAIVGVSATEDLLAVKNACRRRISLLGNLNGLAMRHWTALDAEEHVKQVISSGAPGGGFILSEHHGEIPAPVSEDTLVAISDAVHRWGQYPLSWKEAEPDGSPPECN